MSGAGLGERGSKCSGSGHSVGRKNIRPLWIPADVLTNQQHTARKSQVYTFLPLFRPTTCHLRGVREGGLTCDLLCIRKHFLDNFKVHFKVWVAFLLRCCCCFIKPAFTQRASFTNTNNELTQPHP